MDISNLTTTQLDEVARTRLWLKICQEGQKLFQEGSYPEAEQYFQSALEQSRFLNEVQQATSKNNLAELYRVQGRYADARQ
ncbi:tetratricopeptide repeat protein, partial [bacterium CPR1]|nr:tetratricopeptide repeat protein [bacterium CPR1]